MIAVILSIMMLAGFALLIGAIYLICKNGVSRQPLLMLILSAILFSNVVIWAWPNDRGLAPMNADIAE